MDTTHSRWRWWRARLVAFALLAALASAPRLAAAQAPTAPAVTSGNYTVTYVSCSACVSHWLEERKEGGSWTYLGTGAATISGKPAGVYYYRAAYYEASRVTVSLRYSAETRVVVATSVPTIDPLEKQLGYRYEARYGDANGDGRVDLFLNRTVGGSPGNGAIDTLLLIQDASARFSALVPSAAQASAGRSWPIAAVQVVLRDFNVDGFADVLIKGIGRALGIGGALNQIVYAPGRVLTSLPLGVRAVDSTLKSFVANARDYVVDSSYFRRTAPMQPVLVPVTYVWCNGFSYGYDYGDAGSCYSYTYYATVMVSDYSRFEPHALETWSQEAAIQEGRTSRAQGVENIRRSYETVIGAPIGGRNIDGIGVEQGALDAPGRRGLELFFTILGIYEANAEELDPPRDVGRKPDVVYVTGRRILGFLPFHTALEYAGQTISAYDNNNSFLDDGTLVSQVNWPNDNPALMMTLGTVSSALGAPLYWTRLLAADARYRDNLDYDAIPSVGSAGYNSNGYVHGIVRATNGVPSIDLTKFVGGEKPVPASAFN